MDSKATSPTGRTATLIRQRIEQGGDRLWRLADFRDLPLTAAAQALSRMAKQGAIERLSKGIYYRTRQSTFGKSRPNPAAIRSLATTRKTAFPSGLSAASHLGFTTQNPKRTELATTALSLPRKLVGEDALIHTRRPEAWSQLPATDAAILDFLRDGGKTGELSAKETIERMKALLSEPGRYARLIAIADTEPPRVRAMLGAFGELLRRSDEELKRLRESLNPLSRFDFGIFAGIQSAKNWQAKGTR
ncbi:MAG: hypothetical protein DCC66_02955 [Planctomycetota bacterium]|nr:MAG: hypothetical protein DCC66_02955 [Planctomycetota bacterium]